MADVNLDALLKEAGLAEHAVRVDTNLVRLQWGSAFVIAGISGSAVIAVSPLFRSVPTGRELEFFRTLLEHNGTMGGMAAFAIQPDGWVVLQAARAVKGLDANELGTMVSAVGRFADQYDDELAAKFYNRPGHAPLTLDDADA